MAEQGLTNDQISVLPNVRRGRQRALNNETDTQRYNRLDNENENAYNTRIFRENRQQQLNDEEDARTQLERDNLDNVIPVNMNANSVGGRNRKSRRMRKFRKSRRSKRMRKSRKSKR